MRKHDEPPELPHGTRLLDRYSILDLVGGGGMASIYRATDERLDRVVCVKLLRLEVKPGGSGAGAVYQATYAHFLQEALALSKLQHPNTLRIYDFGYMGDRPLQISEYLDGGDLQMHVRARGAFGAAEALGVLGRIAGALAEAHERGIIHRDIKPSNILFARIGGWLMPKLADFGIAESNLVPRGSSDDSSVSTVALFSPRWAAPEQLVVAPEGTYTDVYALALVAAYLLSGRVAFDGPEVRSTFPERDRSDDLVGERLTQAGLQGRVKDALMRSLATQPERRVQSPLTLFEELRIALDAQPAELAVRPRATVDARASSAPIPAVSGHAPPGVSPHALPPPTSEASSAVRTTRIVEVHEKLELTLTGVGGEAVRFRVSLVPHRSGGTQINVKGLSCFVRRLDEGGVSSPTPALNAHEDGALDFVSAKREWLGRLVWSFGRTTSLGRLFRVSSGDLVVPSLGTAYAVALDLGHDREVVILSHASTPTTDQTAGPTSS
jgi:serine/threonine-protein kinase